MMALIIGSVLFSTLPYLLLTFLPKYLLKIPNIPFLGDWTIYFLLILPLVFTYVLYKKNMRIEQILTLTFPVDLICLFILFIISDLFFYFGLHIEFIDVIMINYYFLTLYVGCSFLLSLYSNFKQKKINTRLQNLTQEKADILKQLIANDQLEKLGTLSLGLLKSNLSFSGDAILLNKENKDSHGLCITITHPFIDWSTENETIIN